MMRVLVIFCSAFLGINRVSVRGLARNIALDVLRTAILTSTFLLMGFLLWFSPVTVIFLSQALSLLLYTYVNAWIEWVRKKTSMAAKILGFEFFRGLGFTPTRSKIYMLCVATVVFAPIMLSIVLCNTVVPCLLGMVQTINGDDNYYLITKKFTSSLLGNHSLVSHSCTTDFESWAETLPLKTNQFRKSRNATKTGPDLHVDDQKIKTFEHDNSVVGKVHAVFTR